MKNFKLFFESWKDYELPNSVEKLVYDFYTLGLIRGQNYEFVKKNTDGLSYRSRTGRDTKELQEDIKNAEMKILPVVADKMISALFIGICSELAHATDIRQNYDDPKRSKLKKSSLFKSFIKDIRAKQYTPGLESDRERADVGIDAFKSMSDSYKDRYKSMLKAMKKTNSNMMDVIRICRYAFENLVWNKDFGGRLWVVICDALEQLKEYSDRYKINPNSEDTTENLMSLIDHIFDLEHNSGTALNKSFDFAIADDHEWLEDLLDYKKYADPYAVAKKASSKMRKLGFEALKAAGQPRKEDKEGYFKTKYSKGEIHPNAFSSIISDIDYKNRKYQVTDIDSGDVNYIDIPENELTLKKRNGGGLKPPPLKLKKPSFDATKLEIKLDKYATTTDITKEIINAGNRTSIIPHNHKRLIDLYDHKQKNFPNIVSELNNYIYVRTLGNFYQILEHKSSATQFLAVPLIFTLHDNYLSYHITYKNVIDTHADKHVLNQIITHSMVYDEDALNAFVRNFYKKYIN